MGLVAGESKALAGGRRTINMRSGAFGPQSRPGCWLRQRNDSPGVDCVPPKGREWKQNRAQDLSRRADTWSLNCAVASPRVSRSVTESSRSENKAVLLLD